MYSRQGIDVTDDYGRELSHVCEYTHALDLT
jgi:hypothetical protein